MRARLLWSLACCLYALPAPAVELPPQNAPLAAGVEDVPVCTAERKDMPRYDIRLQAMTYCDGHKWRIVGQTMQAEEYLGGLSGGAVAYDKDIDVTQFGALDWAIWAGIGLAPDQRKYDSDNLFKLETLRLGSSPNSSCNGPQLTWTVGTPTFNGATNCSIWSPSGFALTAPADQKVRTLTMYVAISNGGSATISARLSDAPEGAGMAAPEELICTRNCQWLYSYTYNAGEAGKKLRVELKPGPASSIGLLGAALQ